MSEEAQRFTQKLQDLQTRVQESTLPAEKKMAQCVLNCYNGSKDYTAVHDCAQQCQQKMQVIAKKIEGEMNSLQGSVQACQQSVMKRLEPQLQTARTDVALQKSLQAEYEQGVTRCIKEAEPLLPGIEARISGYLKEALRESAQGRGGGWRSGPRRGAAAAAPRTCSCGGPAGASGNG
eukprot:CAMPEP_0176245090 /NCGR_PEP_ID=MMETSP0121_2-20121125/31765_1 /TAXON_ID=160619 /ORGANISM="Kryptoperidinium foliaceum, Strain CCMP 1326" /LENGTH=177 /DNA_ID=CAMNT_0017584713 /DNA_START=61 /DNA_END=590 /DNA_ORIENTATION=-